MLTIDLAKFPIYRAIDDLILVGTNHRVDIRENWDKAEQFLEILGKADHLILEGYKSAYCDGKRMTNYEGLAYANRPASTRFIEEGEEFIEKNGIRKDLMGLYMAFHHLPLVTCSNGVMAFKELIDAMGTVYPQVDASTTKRQLDKVLKHHNDATVLTDLGKTWIHTSSKNRNHYIFGPKTKQWKEELEGTKLELVGISHMIFLYQYLQEPVEPLKHWREYLADDLKKVAEDIEENIFRVE